MSEVKAVRRTPIPGSDKRVRALTPDLDIVGRHMTHIPGGARLHSSEAGSRVSKGETGVSFLLLRREL